MIVAIVVLQFNCFALSNDNILKVIYEIETDYVTEYVIDASVRGFSVPLGPCNSPPRRYCFA